jgi:hypothetical protein
VAKIHIQVMLPDVGYSNFKRPAVFCAEKEREDPALRRKMLIESRKCFLETQKINEMSFRFSSLHIDSINYNTF